MQPVACNSQTCERTYSGILGIARLFGVAAGSSTVVLNKTIGLVLSPVQSLRSLLADLTGRLGKSHGLRLHTYRLGKEIEHLKEMMGQRLAANLMEGMSDPADDVEVQELLYAVRNKRSELAELEREIEFMESEAVIEAEPAGEAPPPEEELERSFAEELQPVPRAEPEEQEVAQPPPAAGARRPASLDQIAAEAHFETESEASLFKRIIENARSDLPALRESAIEDAESMGHPAAVEVLKYLATDVDYRIKSQALEALIGVQDESVFPLFEEALNSVSAQVRLAGVRGVYKFDPARAIPYMVQALGDPNIAVRMRAIAFLAWEGAVQAVPHLIPLLKDPNAPVRKAIIEAIERLEGKSAIPDLIEVLDDRSVEVRKCAYQALTKLTGQKIPFKADALREERKKTQAEWESWWIANKDKI